MAANLVITALEKGLGSQSRGIGPFVSELWLVTGATSSTGDTGTLTPQEIKVPLGVIGGPVSFTVSGQVVTLTLLADIGTKAFYVEVFGRP